MRPKPRFCTEAPHSKSLGRVEIWQAIFGSCEGLESFTRDPIGYEGSKWNLYEYARSNSIRSMDPTGLKCCIFIWIGLSPTSGHAALKCGTNPERWPSPGSYYSMYPDGPHDESTDRLGGPPQRVSCTDCLDESAIDAKWQQIRNGRFCSAGGNCSTYVGDLLSAGITSESNSKSCAKDAPCLRCDDDYGCKNKCAGVIFGGLPGVDRPQSAENYFKCLGNAGCDPWTRDCRRRIDINVK